jgi:hypothetical protein
MAADVPMVEADAKPTPSLRVLIILDITGSMETEIKAVKSAVAEMVGLCSGMASADFNEEQDQPSLAFAFITFTEDDNSGCHVRNPPECCAETVVAWQCRRCSNIHQRSAAAQWHSSATHQQQRIGCCYTSLCGMSGLQQQAAHIWQHPGINDCSAFCFFCRQLVEVAGSWWK